MTILVALVLVAVIASIGLQCAIYVRLERAMKPKVGRPRGSRNRAPAESQTITDKAREYFGPADTRKPMSAEDLAELVRYVNEGDARNEMIDPNDEFRTGTNYAGT